MAGKAATLVIRILADARQSSKTFTDASTRAEKWAGGLKKAAIPAAAVITGLGLMAKSAAEDARAQAVLANNLRNSTGATTAQVAAVENWITATALATGVADDELRPAMSALARATGDVTTAQQAMSTVLDVAASTGKDTQAVADAVAKAYAGNTVALSRLVPGIDMAVLKSKDMTKIMGELAAKTGGSAAAAADTAAGKWKRATVAFAEAKEGIGAGLLPVLGQLTGVLATAGAFAATHTGATQTLVITMAALAAAVLAVNTVMKVYTAYTLVAGYVTKTLAGETRLATIATKAWAVAQRVASLATTLWVVAQWALNAALIANPIGLVIVVVIALVAAIVIAYKKSETFRRIVQGAWTGIKTAALSTWNFLKSKVFAPLAAAYAAASSKAGQATALVIAAWNQLKGALKSVYDWLNANVFTPLRTAFDAVVHAVQTVIDWIGRIKIPSGVKWLIDHGKALFSSAGAPAPAPTVRTTGRGATRTPTPAAGNRRSPAGDGLIVNVFLDGKPVAGLVDRIVTRRLDLEGARAAAGAWS